MFLKLPPEVRKVLSNILAMRALFTSSLVYCLAGSRTSLAKALAGLAHNIAAAEAGKEWV
jgi:hypothetical protein